MKFIDTTNISIPFDFEELTSRLPHTSFPPGDFNPPEPFALVQEPVLPTFDPYTEYLEETLPGLVGDTWYCGYLVKKLDSLEYSIAENLRKLNILGSEREAQKQLRAEKVARIKVTISTGKTFDGDEISQNRMSRAILAINASGDTSQLITWVLADNTVTNVSLLELSEALILSGQAQSAVWVI